DHADGLLVRLEQDPEVTEVFTNGALRRGRKIQAIRRPALSTKTFATLRKGKIFATADLDRFVAHVLPRLSDRLPVSVESTKIPGSDAARPYVQMEAHRQGDELLVRAQLVYGKPPRARVVDDRLQLLGATIL